MTEPLRVTVWNEFIDEKEYEDVKAVYADGIHEALAVALREHGFEVGTATLDEPEHGLTEDVLSATDVLLWWGHRAHGDVEDAIVERVHKRVTAGGMGLIVLHSAHYSKIFRKLMGTSCDLKWREIGEMERMWVVSPGHPIVAGLGEYIELEHAEMYGEHFDIPEPDKLIFISWFEGGEVFRSGCCYERGRGKIFYFRPGHESYPIYYKPEIIQVLANAVRWAAPNDGPDIKFGHYPEPLNPVG